MGFAAKSGTTMAYDEVKAFHGQAYTGMSAGGERTWTYPDGLWLETKAEPEKWEFTFSQSRGESVSPKAALVDARDSIERERPRPLETFLDSEFASREPENAAE